MANYYVKSGAAGAADGSTWADAYTTLAAALTARSAGDVFWVSNNHAETQASAMTLTSPGTAAAPCQVLCVDDSAAPPTALATTATISTTGSNSITLAGGFAYYYGVKFQSGSEFLCNVVTGLYSFDGCTIKLNNITSGRRIYFFTTSGTSGTGILVRLHNTIMEFGSTGQFILWGSRIIWTGSGSSVAGSAVTTLFSVNAGGRSTPVLDIRGVDLSLLGSGSSLVGVDTYEGIAYLRNCKLGASYALTTGTIANQGGCTVDMVNCASGDTNYRYAKHRYQGVITDETTIVRTGGASDGTNAFSRKFVSTANSKFYTPLEGPSFRFWNETTGSVTVTVEVVTDNVTLTNAEAWVDVEYEGTSGFPLSLIASDRAADILATPANQTSSSEAWTTTGLTTPIKQALAVTFTTAEKGWVNATVKLAKASTTMYVCPKILSTSYKQTMFDDGSILNDVDVPAVGEVQTGVQYGADGTEFTGTLAGGSGGLLTHPGMSGGMRG